MKRLIKYSIYVALTCMALIIVIPRYVGYITFIKHSKDASGYESIFFASSSTSNADVDNNLISTREYKKDIKSDKVDVSKGLGVLRIGSCNVKAIIQEGVSTEVLSQSLGHFTNTAKIGDKGNFAICGHSSEHHDQLLNGLHNAKIGDKIELITKNNKYVYYVSEIKTIMPTAIYVLNDFGDTRVTIITCTEGGTKRLCVIGSKKKPKKVNIGIKEDDNKLESPLLDYVYRKLKDSNICATVGLYSCRDILFTPYENWESEGTNGVIRGKTIKSNLVSKLADVDNIGINRVKEEE